MNIFDKIRDIWNIIRDKTFDELAVKLGVRLPSEERYTMEAINKRIAFNKDSKKYKPLSHFLSVGIPDMIDTILYVDRYVWRGYRFLKRYFVDRYDIVYVGKRGEYQDIDTRLQSAIINLFLQFVDIECSTVPKNVEIDGVNYLKYQASVKEYSKEKRQAYRELIKAYEYFSVGRKQLEEKISILEDEFFDKTKNSILYSRKLLTNINKAEAKMYATDTKFLNIIVNNRQELWT